MTVCPFAIWRPVANHGGRMNAHLGLVLHVQEGNGGLSGWFNNPNSRASSTWWVSKTGVLEQYVDANLCAWAQGTGNDTYNSVETEGFVSEPLTAAQEATLASLYAWGIQTYRWAPTVADRAGQPGFGWHGMGARSWGGHTGCPGDLRKNRRPAILYAATTGTTPAPTPEQDDDMPKAMLMQAGDHPVYLVAVDLQSRIRVPDPVRLGDIIWCSQQQTPPMLVSESVFATSADFLAMIPDCTP